MDGRCFIEAKRENSQVYVVPLYYTGKYGLSSFKEKLNAQFDTYYTGSLKRNNIYVDEI